MNWSGFWFCIFSVLACPVVQAQDCMALFQRSFSKIKDMPTGTGGLAMKYAVSVQMSNGEIHADDIEVTMLGKRVKVVSRDFTMYQDAGALVVIHPEASTIFLTLPADPSVRQSQLQNFVALQDSLFKYLDLKSCMDEHGNNKTLKALTFQLTSAIPIQSSIRSARYWIEPETESIKKIRIDFPTGNDQEIRSIAFEFFRVDSQNQLSPFEGSAVARVMDAKSNLRAEYKTYSVIDKR